MKEAFTHIPVLLAEILEAFSGVQLKRFFEGTLGLGGHAAEILEAHPEIELYIGCDQDSKAIEIAKKRLEKFLPKISFQNSNSRHLKKILKELGVKELDGFFLTSGSHQCNSKMMREALVL